MDDRLDQFLDSLQEQIFNETREAYGELGFNLWRKPLHSGAMEDADGHGRVTGSCGDTMEIFLKFENDRVKDATFRTDGCGASSVCGSLAADLAIGRSIDELVDLTGEKILDILGVFPEADRHCAFLAVDTVQDAIRDAMQKKADPKKR